MTIRTFRIAILALSQPIDAIRERYGTYGEVYSAYFKDSLAKLPNGQGDNVKVECDSFSVSDKLEFPSWDSLKVGSGGYDAIVMTGSRYTAYENNPPFIPVLIDWLRTVSTEREYAHVKILGMCFGHQIWARVAEGGKVEPGSAWEFGVQPLTLSDEGKKWFKPEEGGDKIHLITVHWDGITVAPPSFKVILSSLMWPIHGMMKEHPDSTPEHPIGQIMTLQGHPELRGDFVKMMIQYRLDVGLCTQAEADQGFKQCAGKHGDGGQGLGDHVAEDIWRFFLGA